MMEMNDDLLIKFLLKETTEAENREVEQWLVADSGNKKNFDDFELIWRESKKLALTSTINQNDAWDRFQNRLAEKQVEKNEIVKPLWHNTF